MKPEIKAPPVCSKHGTEKRRKYNSSLFFCPDCDREKSQARIKNNNSILSRSSIKRKERSLNGEKKSKTPRQKAMDRADMYFSRYIRLLYSVERSGILVSKCYTCGSIHSMKSTDCGHWQRRGYKTTRFNENNARPQCRQCNHYYQGKPEVFERKLIEEIGQQSVNELKELAFETGDDSEQFYREQADIFRLKTKELLKQRNLKDPWKK